MAMRLTIWIAAGVATVLSPLAAKPVVIFTSECSCEGNHGVSRWAAKTDQSEPPSSSAEIPSITPSEIYSWPGPGGKITHSSRRIVPEEKWYKVTGRLTTVRIEDDGDLHMVMADANDQKSGGVVVELPLGERWCELRKTVFSWTDVRFPLVAGKTRGVRLLRDHVITVIGKAFYDIDHSGNDTRNNQRNYDSSLAVWEIHPVMQLLSSESIVGVVPPQPQPQATSQITPLGPVATLPTATPEEVVTITRPITIQIPYGTTVLPRGMKLPVLSRGSGTVDIRYMNARYAIPISATDFR